MTSDTQKRFYYYGGLGALALIFLFVYILRPPAPKPAPEEAVPVPVRPELAEKYAAEPTISVFDHASGQTKQMKLEEYLQGVVAAEMDPNWPAEALAAQAVVARTFTLRSIEDGTGARKHHNTDACTSPEHMQAYSAGKVNGAVRQAVENTRGKVLTYQGDFIHAVFHSWSGGQTATVEEGFVKLTEVERETPYLRSFPDPWDTTVPAKYKEWTVKIPAAEVGKGGAAKNVAIAAKGPSGRATQVTVDGETISGPELRRRLGPTKLFSTLITSVKREGKNVVFTGRGWGHGVGMAQWGAHSQAEQGKGAVDILRFYYPGADLQQLWQ
ncbi:MAG: SpoIID/LytB domain-containing protein [bacterium]